MTDTHLRSVHVELTETARRLRLAGTPIHLLECCYLPEERLICSFAATAETQVRHAVDLAQLPLPSVCRPANSEDGSESGPNVAAPFEPYHRGKRDTL